MDELVSTLLASSPRAPPSRHAVVYPCCTFRSPSLKLSGDTDFGRSWLTSRTSSPPSLPLFPDHTHGAFRLSGTNEIRAYTYK